MALLSLAQARNRKEASFPPNRKVDFSGRAKRKNRPQVAVGYTSSKFYDLGAPMKLLIRNLARTVTEANVREMFEAYGRVQSCSLVIDKKTGTSKGFGFVEMPKPGEAKAAMKNLNGTVVADQKIRVKKAEPSPGGTPE